MNSFGFLRSTEFLGIVLFAFSAGLPPFDDATEVDLTLHMLQHVMIVIAGVLIAYPHLGKRLGARRHGGPLPWLALLGASSLLLYWHLPGPWDLAVINPGVHVIEHLSFLLVGFLAGSWLLLLTDSGKIGGLLAAFFGHMGYAAILISPWNIQVYSLYSLPNQMVLGWSLLLTGPILVVGMAYVIARNPSWLAGFSGCVGPGAPRQTILNRVKVPRLLVPVLSIALVLAMVGYFAAAAYAVGTAPSAPAGTTKVLISETPVSWQYLPQNTTVILGVNSTVTWVSRSISYDTVSSRVGAFDSGPIPPGGTFTFTFDAPGVYSYYCIYHPWMTGTIRVLRHP